VLLRLDELVADSTLNLLRRLLRWDQFPTDLDDGLKLAAELAPSHREKLRSDVEVAFRRFLLSSEEHDPSVLPAVLDSYPAFGSSFREDLLAVLREKFENFVPSRLRFIGVLIDALAPRRIGRVPTVSLDAQIGPGSLLDMNGISNAIRSQAPDFWAIINDYRELIANLIRDDPALLGSEFQFLLDYPELLSFQEKLDYFRTTQENKIRGSSEIKLRVRRSEVLRDTFAVCSTFQPNQFLRKFRIEFSGEAGIDGGGLRREWFRLLIRELFAPDLGLFRNSSNQQTYQPNHESFVNAQHLEYFTFAGRIIGRAAIENIPIEPHLSSAALRDLLHRPVSLRDLEQTDPSLYSSFRWILDHDLVTEGCPDMTFSVDNAREGAPATIELIENGSNIIVTNENKEEYVNRMVEHYLRTRISEQLSAFRVGFHSMITPDEIRIFSPRQLDLLLCGVPTIDINDFQANCFFLKPYTRDHPVILLFFQVISEWNIEQLAELLSFITGSARVPVGGFATFRETGHPISIGPGGPRGHLPVAHTCCNTLALPEYEAKDEMTEKLQYALHETDGFAIF
jgi:E3 ubiquitin-protein ligase HUWE1